MKLPSYMTRVTTFSKLLALSMLVIFPICAFFLGRYYQQVKDKAENASPIPTASPVPQPKPISDTSCESDSDCQLTNINDYSSKNTMVVCCNRPSSCSPQDLSQSNWVAKTSQWLQEQKTALCDATPRACPMVMIAQCMPRYINDNYEAKCVNSVCQKVLKPKTGAPAKY